MTKNKLYAIVIAALLGGYAWLVYNSTLPAAELNRGPTVCLFKNLTGLPCPSCGSTRSMVLFIRGDYAAAALWNPVGLILLAAMIVLPIWIFFDLVKKKSSFFIFYRHFELFLKRKPVMLIFIILVLVNWIWNINKGL